MVGGGECPLWCSCCFVLHTARVHAASSRYYVRTILLNLYTTTMMCVVGAGEVFLLLLRRWRSAGGGVLEKRPRLPGWLRVGTSGESGLRRQRQASRTACSAAHLSVVKGVVAAVKPVSPHHNPRLDWGQQCTVTPLRVQLVCAVCSQQVNHQRWPAYRMQGRQMQRHSTGTYFLQRDLGRVYVLTTHSHQSRPRNPIPVRRHLHDPAAHSSPVPPAAQRKMLQQASRRPPSFNRPPPSRPIIQTTTATF